jgi:hypothetical protein
VEPSTERENDAELSHALRVGVGLMIVILIGLALVAIYANLQKGRGDRIEQVIITPASTATPVAASASTGLPSPQ